MPVLSMHEVNWDESLTNGSDMQALRQNMGGVRSQDDARVGYMFQRPDSQAGKVAEPAYGNKAWLGRERTALEQVTRQLSYGLHLTMHRTDQDFGLMSDYPNPNRNRN